MKKQDYTTVRINRASAKQLERIAVLLAFRDEKSVDKAEAFEVAVNIAKNELEKVIKK